MANVQQPVYDPTDMTGLYEDLQQGLDDSNLPPVPQNPDQPYGPPAVTRDIGPQSSTMNPMAVALAQGGMHPISGQVSDVGSAPPQSGGFMNMLANALAGGTPTQGSHYNPQTGEFLPQGSYAQPSAAPPPAPPAVAPRGAATPIAGQTADMADNAAPAEDQTTAAYRALHDSEVREFERTKSLAQQAAAAGNTEMSAEYVKAANAAYARANEISKLAIEYNKPEADSFEHVQLPDGRIVPFNKSTGEFGAPFGPGGPKAKPPQWEVTGTDIYGNPQHGWVMPPEPGAVPTGAVSPSGAAPAPVSAPGTAPATTPSAMPTTQDAAAAIAAGRERGLTGEALLNTIPPQIADHVRAIAAGDEPMPVTGVAQTKPIEQLTADAVRAAYPGTSAADFNARAQAKKDMAPGGKDQLMIEKLNSAVGHSTDELVVGKDLNNFGSTALNWATDQFYPSSAPVSQKVAQFNNLGALAGPELQSVYTPTGGAEAERQGQAKSMTAYMSGEEMEAVHASRMRAVAERVGAIDKQYNDAMGKNAPPWSGLTQQSLEQLQKYANDKLPARLQAKDSSGNPIAPATVDNGFRFGATGPAPLAAPPLEGMAESHPWATAGGLLAAPALAGAAGLGAGALGRGAAAAGGSAMANPLAAALARGIGHAAPWAGGAYIGRRLFP